uniref:CAAX prenyl protease n=1 Tax=Compsopogon caeruleus TaxID=31354 RepID=A0A7S1TBI6_9RHOD
MEAVVGFSIFLSVFEFYLLVRQRRRYYSTQPPPELAELVPRDKFDQSQHYGRAKSALTMVEMVVSTLTSVYFLMYGVYPRLWNVSLEVMTRVNPEWSDANEIVRTLVFAGLLYVIGKVCGLPFEVYSTFIVEKRFGFNRTTVGTFIKDEILGALVTAVLGGVILPTLWYIIDRGGSNLWIKFYLFCTFFMLLMTIIFPNLIAPLFNKFVPLEEGELRSRVYDMASSIRFPLGKIYVMDGSKRSTHSNAYFYGVFTKGIVLFDSLLEQCKGKDNEVLAVLCHELGHWKKGHTRKGLTIRLAHLFLLSWLYGKTAGNVHLFESFGFSDQPHIIGLILFSLILTPLESAIELPMNWLSRLHEYQADAFAVHFGYEKALCSALVNMHIENLSNCNPDPLYSAYHNSHPTLAERLGALQTFSRELESSKPKAE